MNNFPFFRFPYNNYYRYYNRYPKNDTFTNNTHDINENYSSEKNNVTTENTQKREDRKSSKYTAFGPIIFNSSSFSDLEQPILEILGLKLYLDDLIILALLFFLYKEDVKDESLFIALILLLLS